MDIQKELFYKEFVQRESGVRYAPYHPELEFYSAVKAGDTKKVERLCKEALLNKKGMGTLSENPLQNIKFHFVITAAMSARYCIEGGMELAAAYSLSDFYIQRADRCRSLQAVSDLHRRMCLDYTGRMKNLRRQKVCSRHVADCIDYIYEHLHTRIRVDELAAYTGLSPAYLSRLFKQETGSTLSAYIRRHKLETAQNMLVYSDYTPGQIAAILAFPSQSYFTEIFKKETGLTPTRYRALYFRSTEMAKTP